jgi:hypothetical protein
LTRSDKSKLDKPKPLAGGVRHDARGNAVWQWASETARHAAASTSQLLRRLNVSGLSLQDDARAPEAHGKPVATKPAPVSPAAPGKPAAPVRKAQGGFNPYDRSATPRAVAANKRPPAMPPRARSSWWRRLLVRR